MKTDINKLNSYVNRFVSMAKSVEETTKEDREAIESGNYGESDHFTGEEKEELIAQTKSHMTYPPEEYANDLMNKLIGEADSSEEMMEVFNFLSNLIKSKRWDKAYDTLKAIANRIPKELHPDIIELARAITEIRRDYPPNAREEIRKGWGGLIEITPEVENILGALTEMEMNLDEEGLKLPPKIKAIADKGHKITEKEFETIYKYVRSNAVPGFEID